MANSNNGWTSGPRPMWALMRSSSARTGLWDVWRTSSHAAPHWAQITTPPQPPTMPTTALLSDVKNQRRTWTLNKQLFSRDISQISSWPLGWEQWHRSLPSVIAELMSSERSAPVSPEWCLFAYNTDIQIDNIFSYRVAYVKGEGLYCRGRFSRRRLKKHKLGQFGLTLHPSLHDCRLKISLV